MGRERCRVQACGTTLAVAASIAFSWLTIVPLPANAAPGWCEWSSTLWANVTGERRYRVNTGSFALLNPPDQGPITPLEGLTAVVMGADKWNEQANSGTFVYDGESTRTSLPETLTECQSQNANYSLVVVLNDSSRDKARTEGRCYDGDFATQFISDVLGRTSIPPAVACSQGSAGGYDCILAYTDQADPLSRVRVRRFSAIQGGNRYSILVLLDPQAYQLDVQTASSLALWNSEGAWNLVVRPIRSWGGQQMERWASNDGANWFFLGTVGYSALGPSAVSYWHGDENMLVYAR